MNYRGISVTSFLKKIGIVSLESKKRVRDHYRCRLICPTTKNVVISTSKEILWSQNVKAFDIPCKIHINDKKEMSAKKKGTILHR